MSPLFPQRPSRPDRQWKLSPRGGPGSIDRNIPSTAQTIWRQAVVTTTVHLSQTNWNLKSEAVESRSEFAKHHEVHRHRARRAMLLLGLAQLQPDPGVQFPRAQLGAACGAFRRRERGAPRAERHPDMHTDSH